MEKIQKQYGLWKSSLSPEMLAGEARLSDVQWAGDGQTLVWLERKDGRGVLKVRRPNQAPRPINDALNIGGGVGYGGGGFCVGEQTVIFAAKDGRLYRADLDRGLPQPITPEWGSVASPALSPDGRWVAYVHRHDDVDRIGLVDVEGKRWPLIAAEGADFYMQPAWHPDGNHLVWVRWDHPNMPWNGTVIETAAVAVAGTAASVGEPQFVTGADDVACQQPSFSPDGNQLAYLSDASGHWQVYVRDRETGEDHQISKAGREYGGPAWIQGLRYYGWSADSETIVAISTQAGVSRLERLGLGEDEKVDAFGEYTALGQLSVSSTGAVAAIGESSEIPPRVVSFSDADGERVESFGSTERLGADCLSTVEPRSWPVDDDNVDCVHGLYYEPTNPKFESNGKPPAIIMIHGGPTSQRVAGWEPRNQFFASRGFAVLDVNYRGSTGYGRDYMEALFGKWGVADVEDAVGGANFLVKEGMADEDKVVIMGGSAGGYTVLQALVNHPGVFSAGVCSYGISDLFALQMGTHKFEARYNDTLIGPLPEAADEYRRRSPLNSAEKIEDSLALFHGAKDKVVPPEQAEVIAESLGRRGVPHLYHVYEEEGHGWRAEDTIVHFHETVLEFLVKNVVFG